MPRIRPYESQVSSQGDLPNRSAGLQDFGGAGLSNLGQGVENLGASAGQAQRILNEAKARKEVTDAQVSVAQLGTDLTRALDEHAKNWTPDKPPLSETFLAGQVKLELDNLRGPEGSDDRFETEAGASTFALRAQALTAHMTDLTRSADAKLAGEAAVTQHREVVDTAGNFLQSHPSYFQIKREEVASIINDPNGIYGRIPAVERQKLTRLADEQLAISSVQGFIRKSPNRALEVLRDPLLKQDEQFGWIANTIPNEKLAPLINHAETEVRALDISRKQEAEEERRRIHDLSESTNSALEQQRALHLIDPKSPKVTPRDVLDAGQNRGLSSEKQGMWLNMIEEQARRGPAVIHSNPIVKQQLFKDMIRPFGDPKKLTDTTAINQAYLRGQLNDTDLDWLVKKFTDGKSPDGETLASDKRRFYKNVEQMITKPGPFGIFADPSTGIQLDRFVTDTENLAEEYVKKGKNPRDLFTFGKPEYRGHPSVLNEYQNKGFGSIEAPQASTPAPSARPKRSLDDIFKGK